MSDKVGFILTDRSLTLRWKGVTRTVDRSDSAFETVMNFYRQGDYDSAMKAASPAEKIVMYGNGLFGVLNGVVLVDGVAAPEELNREILTFIEQKLPPEPLVYFVRNVRKNPSYRSVNQLWGFVKANSICVNEDGMLVLYKRVLGEEREYFDIHTGHTHRNTPGETIRMPRNKVNDNPEVTCSYGLHVAAWEYAHKHFASGGSTDVIMEVLVSPEHVVSIPVDYNNAKMRVCEYKVLGPVQNPESSALKYVATDYNSGSFTVTDDDSSDDDENEEEEEYSSEEEECEYCWEPLSNCYCDECQHCGYTNCKCDTPEKEVEREQIEEEELDSPLAEHYTNDVKVGAETDEPPAQTNISTTTCCAAVSTLCVHANCSDRYCDVFSNDGN